MIIFIAKVAVTFVAFIFTVVATGLVLAILFYAAGAFLGDIARRRREIGLP